MPDETSTEAPADAAVVRAYTIFLANGERILLQAELAIPPFEPGHPVAFRAENRTVGEFAPGQLAGWIENQYLSG